MWYPMSRSGVTSNSACLDTPREEMSVLLQTRWRICSLARGFLSSGVSPPSTRPVPLRTEPFCLWGLVQVLWFPPLSKTWTLSSIRALNCHHVGVSSVCASCDGLLTCPGGIPAFHPVTAGTGTNTPATLIKRKWRQTAGRWLGNLLGESSNR